MQGEPSARGLRSRYARRSLFNSSRRVLLKLGREHGHEILSRRLYEGTMYTHLMTRAAEAARIKVMSAAPQDELPDQEILTAAYQGTIQASFEHYLGLFSEKETLRAGFGLGVARLLQFYLGLESVKDAVIFPMDRRSFQLGEQSCQPSQGEKQLAAGGAAG